MWKNNIRCKYMFLFTLKNLARKGLLQLMSNLFVMILRRFSTYGIVEEFINMCNLEGQDMFNFDFAMQTFYVFVLWLKAFMNFTNLMKWTNEFPQKWTFTFESSKFTWPCFGEILYHCQCLSSFPFLLAPGYWRRDLLNDVPGGQRWNIYELLVGQIWQNCGLGVMCAMVCCWQCLGMLYMFT